MKKVITLSFLLSILLSSCYVNRITVGPGPVGETLRSRTYSIVKQRYLIFGLIRLNHGVPEAPPINVGYEIKSSFSFVDGLLTCITGGIYGQRTVRILVDKNVEQNLRIEKEARSTVK